MDPANPNVPESTQDLTFNTTYPSEVNPDSDELPGASPQLTRQNAVILPAVSPPPPSDPAA